MPQTVRRTAKRSTARHAAPALKVHAAAFANDLGSKINRLIDTYGVTGVAGLLGVSKSQPSRWRSGHDAPSQPVVLRIHDLDYLTSRLAEELTAEQAQAWFAGSNPFLAGSSPAVVFAAFGMSRLEPAVAALETGAMV